jgi:hypothetical protein
LREEAAEVVGMAAAATVAVAGATEVAAASTGEVVFMARSEDFMDPARALGVGLMVLRIMAARCI